MPTKRYGKANATITVVPYSRRVFFAAWVREHWRTVLQIIAWVLLFISGSTGLGHIGAIQDRVIGIQSQLETAQKQNEALNLLVEALQRENALLRERIEFLQECLTRPLPWPGGTLCSKAKEP